LICIRIFYHPLSLVPSQPKAASQNLVSAWLLPKGNFLMRTENFARAQHQAPCYFPFQKI